LLRNACVSLAVVALVLTLGCDGQIDQLAALREQLTSADIEQRRAAVAELAQVGPLNDEDLARVATALADEDSQVQREAARLLVAQAFERPELRDRLVDWASQSTDAQSRELLEKAAIGKWPAPVE
jgi:HEAT repeat protein